MKNVENKTYHISLVSLGALLEGLAGLDTLAGSACMPGGPLELADIPGGSSSCIPGGPPLEIWRSNEDAFLVGGFGISVFVSASGKGGTSGCKDELVCGGGNVVGDPEDVLGCGGGVLALAGGGIIGVVLRVAIDMLLKDLDTSLDSAESVLVSLDMADKLSRCSALSCSSSTFLVLDLPSSSNV